VSKGIAAERGTRSLLHRPASLIVPSLAPLSTLNFTRGTVTLMSLSLSEDHTLNLDYASLIGRDIVTAIQAPPVSPSTLPRFGTLLRFLSHARAFLLLI
jgi:hypothetical protein